MRDADYDYDLGDYRRPVTTSSPAAQLWFDRGLAWTYGFNHEEAVACFERATIGGPRVRHGVLGNRVLPGPQLQQAVGVLRRGRPRTYRRTHPRRRRPPSAELAAGAAPVERALIQALRARYPSRVAVEDCSVWNPGYADAHADVYDRVPRRPRRGHAVRGRPDEPHALAALGHPYGRAGTRAPAPSRPGPSWTRRSSSQDRRRTPGRSAHVRAPDGDVLRRPNRRCASPTVCARLVPDAGHLRHMPSHLDILCGDYKAAIEANSGRGGRRPAVPRPGRTDELLHPLPLAQLPLPHLRGDVPGPVRGRRSTTVERLEASIPEDLLRVRVPADGRLARGLPGHARPRADPLRTMGRRPRPRAPRRRRAVLRHHGHDCTTPAAWRLAATGRDRRGRGRARSVPRGAARGSPRPGCCSTTPASTSSASPARCSTARSSTARAMSTRRSRTSSGPSSSTTSCRTTSRGGGCSRPGMRTARSARAGPGRGGQRRVRRRPRSRRLPAAPPAAPDNVWSLHGYHECLHRLGRHAECAIIGRQLALAQAWADVPIEASCFCRLETSHESHSH